MTPYEEGYQAYDDNLCVFDNPYLKDEPAYVEWDNGLAKAMEDHINELNMESMI